MEPRWVRVYDNGGETADRYTVVYTGRRGGGIYLGMNEHPTHPQGFGQHGEAPNGGRIDAPRGGWAPAIRRSCHLGKRIPWTDLPEECQRVAFRTYRELWGA